MEDPFDLDYWKSRWQHGETEWDIGYVSPPIQEYIDQMVNKDKRILIPGCGNAWEGEYLIKQGFNDTWLIDIAPEAVAHFRKRFPQFPPKQIITGDFFELDKKFD